LFLKYAYITSITKVDLFYQKFLRKKSFCVNSRYAGKLEEKDIGMEGIIIKPLPNWLAIIFKLKTQRESVINIPTQHRFAQNVL